MRSHTAGRALERLRATSARLLSRAEERVGITRTGVLLLALAVVGWLLARLLGSRAVFLIAYGCVITVVGAWLLGRRRLDVHATRSSLGPRVRAGQPVEVQIALTPRRRASNVVVEEVMPSLVGPSVRIPFTDLPAKRAVRHDYRFVPRHRGVYDVGPLVLTRSDPFGLTTRRSVLSDAAEIVVHPATEPVQDRVATRAWEDPPIRPPVSRPWPTGFELYGLRDYSVGDDPRRIVWRASARMVDPVTGEGRYVVRESEQGITDRVSLLLDTHGRTHSPGNPSDTFETAVRAVASLGVHHLHDGFAVTLETNEGRLAAGLRGERHRVRLLDALARVQPGRVPLASMAERLAADRRRHNLHTVVVTADLDAETAARLRRVAERESLLVVLVVWADTDPASVRRAASLGANVVEVQSGMALRDAFRKVAGAGVRRESGVAT